MRRLSVQECETYLDTGSWEGKAGAYGIQDEGDPFVTIVEGGFDNVVGLPTDLVRDMLTRVSSPTSR
jgi:septum formation protein